MNQGVFQNISFEQHILTAGHGGFWDHYIEYWKLRNESNILILKFEDMIKVIRLFSGVLSHAQLLSF